MLVTASRNPRRPEAPVSGPTRDDHELIRACLEGSQEAFAALVKRHEERSFWAAYRVVGNADAARDVAQEAFVRVWRALERFDFSMAFTTWLYRITVNLAIDHLRRNKRHKGVDIEIMQETLADDAADLAPDHRRTQSELAHRVRGVLNTLDEKYRTVIALRDLEGLSSKQISDISGISHATVRWRLHVARKQFREAWERLESRLEKDRRQSPDETETESATRQTPPA